MINLLIFYTEGGEKDQFRPMDVSKLNKLISNLSTDIKTDIYTPRKLKNEFSNSSFVFHVAENVTQQFKKRNINYDWYRINNQTWKPFLILNTLKKLNEGDILYYHDCDIEKYPEYQENFSLSPESIIRILNGNDVMLFSDNNMKMYHDCKYELMEKYDLLSYINKNHIWSGSVILKKSKTSLSFIESWYNLHTEGSNASQIYDSALQHKDFIWHTPEQSTLGCTYYLWHKNNKIQGIGKKQLWYGRIIDANIYKKLKGMLIRILVFSKVL